MRYNSKTLPESILRCMPKEDRLPLGKAGATISEIAEKVTIKREKELQERCAGLLVIRNIAFFRQPMHKRALLQRGTPDFLFAVKGRACGVECKLPGQYPTEEQELCMEHMRVNGWHIAIVTSEQAFLDFLNEMEAI